MSNFDEGNFNDKSEAKSSVLEWGKIGDFLVGTFVKARHDIETKYGPNSMYELVAERGQYHRLFDKVPDATATVINKGEVFNVWGRNDIFNGIMNGLRPGQIVKLTFTEEKKTANGVGKIIKVYTPKDNEGKFLMDDAWLNNQGVTGADM
jgi:hypothetical protein